MVKSLGSVTSFKAKNRVSTHTSTHQKNKTPKTLSFRGVIVESEGIGLFGDILSYIGKSFIHGGNIILFPYIYPY